MGLFSNTKYEWKDPKLRRKNKVYNGITLVALVVALVCLYTVSSGATIGFMLLAVAFICMVLSWKAQSKDKELKAKRS